MHSIHTREGTAMKLGGPPHSKDPLPEKIRPADPFSEALPEWTRTRVRDLVRRLTRGKSAGRDGRIGKEQTMTTERQRAAARKNIKKAARAARDARTIAHLPKKTRTALGKQANKVKRQRQSS